MLKFININYAQISNPSILEELQNLHPRETMAIRVDGSNHLLFIPSSSKLAIVLINRILR